MKVLLVNELNGDIVELANYGGFVDSSVVDYIKSHYIQSLSWNSTNDKLEYSFGENFPGTTYSIKIYPDACRYRHYYTLRVNSNWVNQTISFTLDLSTATPLNVNGLRNWFVASPFWDIVSPANSTTKKLFPVVGVAGVQSTHVNNTSGNPVTIYSPYSIVGLCYYIEQQGMIINTTLYAYYNYGAYVSVDENTLNCSGILDVFTGKWIV